MDQQTLILPVSDTAAPDTVAKASTVSRWGLPDEAAEDIQGIVVSPFVHLHYGMAVFVTLDKGCGGAWLQALLGAGMITDATGRSEPSGAVALSYAGLVRMGLDEDVLATFAAPFREGMTDPARQRRLGDSRREARRSDALAWSGQAAGPDSSATLDGQPHIVHALLLLYAPDASALDALVAKATGLMRDCRANAAFTLPLTLQPGGPDPATPPREHFGFADGFSQPMPHTTAGERDPLHGVPVGEVLMGYENAHGEAAPAPSVARTALANTRWAARLAAVEDTAAQASLGFNGTYMTVRQLHQNVAAFRDSMADAAAALDDPAITADWLAERVIGRERDGDLLIPGGSLPAVAGQPDNNFGYFAKDRRGLGCPVGSHIRRANPRDGLAKDETSRTGTLKSVNNHRILRRARKYGEPLPEGAPDDGAGRGLLFMCLHTDIARQFEFIQQTWMLNPVFATLAEETDPLLGPAGPFTIPADPLRHWTQVKTFVQLVGGEYFFLPSMSVLGYLGDLTAKVS